MDKNLIAIILALTMALVTYIIRVIPFAFFRKKINFLPFSSFARKKDLTERKRCGIIPTWYGIFPVSLPCKFNLTARSKVHREV